MLGPASGAADTVRIARGASPQSAAVTTSSTQRRRAPAGCGGWIARRLSSPTTASTVKTTLVAVVCGLVAELNMLAACSGARSGQLQGLVIALARIGLAAAVRAGLKGWYGGGLRVLQRACG